MQTSPRPASVRFGSFELDPAAGELFRNGVRIRLQGQPLQVLIALLERPGELVTRDDLRERLWSGETFVDFEHGLNTAVKKARQALGDSAESPEFIETLARRGYRFIADVQASTASTPVNDSAAAADHPTAGGPAGPAQPTVERPVRQLRRMLLWGAGAALIIAGAAAGWLTQRQTSPESSNGARHPTEARLAVMPLRILGDSRADIAYLGVGIADAITTRLANTRQITVRPTSAVLPFNDAQSDTAHVATSLNVQHLLIGTIQTAEDVYRISLQLVRADGVAIWGRSYDEPRTSLLELQDDVAEQVAVALRIELSPPERARLHVRYTDNPQAYDLYLRGRSLLVNYTEATMREAIRHFEQALALDPDYALAAAGIATASAWFSVRYAHDAEAMEWGKRAEEAAHQALEKDPALADAHLAIASAAGTTYRGFDWHTVLERTSTALALDPSADLAHLARMRVYYHLGLFDEARREGRLAQAINATASVEYSRLEVALRLFDGDFAAAAAEAAALLSRSDIPAVRHYLGLARYYVGDTAGAREMLGSMSRRGRPDTRSQAALASIEAAAGMRDEARGRIRIVVSAPDMDHHVAYHLGASFAQLGEVDASMKWLTQAADTGFPCYPWFARDPLLDPLRRRPAFEDLLAQLRLAHQEAGRRAMGHPALRGAAQERPLVFRRD